MKRIFASLVASCILLTGCGKVQSPDFDATLKAIDIEFTRVAGSTDAAPATVALGGTLQFVLIGLYSTPPGTRIDNVQTFGCGRASTEACTQGAVGGVNWSVDASATNMPVASIDTKGMATGLRRGTATIRAKVAGVEDITEQLLVSGAVLTSFRITATPGESVPTGRTITLTATPSCSDNSGSVSCVRDYSNYSWSLPSNFPADTVSFSPNPPTGKTITVKTQRFGAFSIDASATNEEDTRVLQSINLTATRRVLDDIIISADPAVVSPVLLIKGTRTRFVAKGRFSDGQIGDISIGDLGGTGKSLTWTPDGASIGQVDANDIENSAAPNTAIVVTVKTDARLGSSAITASGVNTESTPLAVDDRILVDVRDLGLLALTRICLDGDAGNLCSANVQIPLLETFTFKARGTFMGDAAGVEREIAPNLIGITWGKTQASTNVTVNATTGAVTGNAQGQATINVSLNTGVAPSVTDRDESTVITVVDQLCRDQLLASNGAAATTADSNTAASSGSSASNAGNVISGDPTKFGTFMIGPSSTAETLGMIFRRDAVVITPSASGGQNIGFLLQYADPSVVPDSLLQLQTVNAAGVVVQTFDNVSPQTVPRGTGANSTYYLYAANASMPYSGVRINAKVPAASLTAIDPTDPTAALLGLLGQGESFDIKVFTTCANSKSK